MVRALPCHRANFTTRHDVIITADRIFACEHRFVVKEEASFSFVCERCDHHVQELPVVRFSKPAGRVLPFPAPVQPTLHANGAHELHARAVRRP